jgi:hypothetical protein
MGNGNIRGGIIVDFGVLVSLVSQEAAELTWTGSRFKKLSVMVILEKTL